MNLDTKAALRRVVQSYVSEVCPERLDEFEAVFDGVCDSLSKRFQEAPDSGLGADQEGAPFDADMVSAGVIVVASFVGFSLLKAVGKYVGKALASEALTKAQEELTQRYGRPDLVRRIRQIVEGIVKEL